VTTASVGELVPAGRADGLGCQAEAPPASEATIEALKFHHLMLPASSADRPLAGVRLRLKVDGWTAGNWVNVRMHDTFNLWRELADMDLRLTTRASWTSRLPFRRRFCRGARNCGDAGESADGKAPVRPAGSTLGIVGRTRRPRGRAI